MPKDRTVEKDDVKKPTKIEKHDDPKKSSKAATNDTKKESKPSDKKDKKDNDEKVPRTHPNKDTEKANLHFNVKTTNKWLKEYFSSYTVERKKKNNDNDGDNKKTKKEEEDQEIKNNSIKMNGAQYALTAVDEVLCVEMANLAFGKTTKDKAGLYLIKEDLLLDSMKLNKDFAFSFGKFFDSYSSKEKYGKQLSIEKKDVLKLLETCAFSGGNTSVNLDDSAYNLMMYVVLKNRILVAETTYQMLLYSKKASIDGRAVIHSVRAIYCGTTELHKTLSRKAEATNALIKGEKAKEGTEDGESKKGSDGLEKKSSKKDTKDTKDAKKNAKTKDASDSESDAESTSSEKSEDAPGSDDD